MESPLSLSNSQDSSSMLNPESPRSDASSQASAENASLNIKLTNLQKINEALTIKIEALQQQAEW